MPESQPVDQEMKTKALHTLTFPKLLLHWVSRVAFLKNKNSPSSSAFQSIALTNLKR